MKVCEPKLLTEPRTEQPCMYLYILLHQHIQMRKAGKVRDQADHLHLTAVVVTCAEWSMCLQGELVCSCVARSSECTVQKVYHRPLIIDLWWGR